MFPLGRCQWYLSLLILQSLTTKVPDKALYWFIFVKFINKLNVPRNEFSNSLHKKSFIDLLFMNHLKFHKPERKSLVVNLKNSLRKGAVKIES